MVGLLLNGMRDNSKATMSPYKQSLESTDLVLRIYRIDDGVLAVWPGIRTWLPLRLQVLDTFCPIWLTREGER